MKICQKHKRRRIKGSTFYKNVANRTVPCFIKNAANSTVPGYKKLTKEQFRVAFGIYRHMQKVPS